MHEALTVLFPAPVGPINLRNINIRRLPSGLEMVTHGIITSFASGFQSNVGITFGVADSARDIDLRSRWVFDMILQ